MNFLEPAYIIVIGISATASVISFKKPLPFHFKLFSVLLGITFIIEICAVYLVRALDLGNNSQFYNSFMLVEFCIYFVFFQKIFSDATAIKISQIFLVILPVCWLDSTVLKFGFTKWNSYFLIIGSCFTITLALAYYRQLITASNPVKLLRHPEFFIATGILVFYTCQLPYLGSLNYLIKYNRPMAEAFLSVLRILNIFMYSLFTYAYICQMKNRK